MYSSLNSNTGRPIFQDPVVERVRRVAVIDVGSNSVRMVVFDGAARSPAYFYNEKVLCGLGASLAKTGKLDPKGKKRALAALSRFVTIAKMMNVSDLVGVATAALRDASDGQEFASIILKETGLDLTIASGSREAHLAANGVILGWPEANGLVSDIGGVSMELADVNNGKVGLCETSSLGPLVLERLDLDNSSLENHVMNEILSLRTRFARKYDTIYLVGGSWRAIAKLDIYRRNYPLKVLNEYKSTPEEYFQTLEWAEKHSAEHLQEKTKISLERLKHIPKAGIALKALINGFLPKEIAISSNGIREGLLYLRMPKKLKDTDPLLEACSFSEYSSARLPGYGNYLYEFIIPLFKKQTSEKKRLIKAACLLHDVSWRAHPDYRAIICFENATRANLGGLDHPGRVFLALSLFHRYKNQNEYGEFQNLLSLLDPVEIKLAEVVGKAMRLGAMLLVVSPEGLTKLKFKPKKNNLVLNLPEKMRSITGEVVNTRFKALATAMDCEAEFNIEETTV